MQVGKLHEFKGVFHRLRQLPADELGIKSAEGLGVIIFYSILIHNGKIGLVNESSFRLTLGITHQILVVKRGDDAQFQIILLGDGIGSGIVFRGEIQIGPFIVSVQGICAFTGGDELTSVETLKGLGLAV
jgi:hypothetical protein